MSFLEGSSTAKMEEWREASVPVSRDGDPLGLWGWEAVLHRNCGGLEVVSSQAATATAHLRDKGSPGCQVSHVLVRVAGQ